MAVDKHDASNVPFPVVLTDSPALTALNTHDGHMRARLTAISIAMVLAATMVGCAPAPARARVLAAHDGVSCSTERLPLTKGHPVRTTASLDGTVATLRGTSGHAYFRTPRLLHSRLTLTSPAGVVTTFHPKPVAQTPGRGVLVMGVNAPGGGTPALCLATFAARPVALLGVTSAFNQCCFLLDTYAPGVRPRSSLQDGLVGPRLRIINGAAAIVTADGGFLAQFTDYADSAAPLRIITVRHGRQRDVTDSYRTRLRHEASGFKAAFDRDPTHGLGFLAAWAADQERLGHDSLVFSTLQQLDDAGKLSGMAGWPRNQAYISALKTLLTNRGYR